VFESIYFLANIVSFFVLPHLSRRRSVECSPDHLRSV
jgi:hypothetical protein